ncbi:hypothetical protein E3J79_03440 [Candidatus Dependentiae bacterium]|nr:MAG: hypothetical protein E3J79_03440 [Candidatus Dependentiae bacterium]
MHKRITFRAMDHSTVMEEYANQQLEKIVQFLKNERSPIYLDLILEPSKIHAHHRIELRVKTPRFDLISNYEGPDFYEVLDRVIDVMYKDLHLRKKEWKDAIESEGRRESAKCWWEGMEGTPPKRLSSEEEVEKEEGFEFEEEE